MSDDPNHPDPGALPFLSQGGEMGERMRTHDWSTSPLGDPAHWPQSLRSVVGLLLNSKFPMFVAWGDELGFLYNDAYTEILGNKHPQALGARFHDIWSEIWPDISPLIDAAMAGEATYRQNLLLRMNRKGYDEATWFTFSYSPVRDESGAVAGMFCACTETTGQVLAERRLADEAMAQQRLFEQAPGFICILRGPQLVYEFLNRTHRRLFGSDDWLGKPAREAAPQLVGQGFYELLDRVYATGERHVGSGATVRNRRTPDGPEEERYIDFIFAPMLDGDGRVTGIFCEGFDVTEVHRAREALGKSEARLQLALDAVSAIGIWDWDIRNDLVYADERFAALYSVDTRRAAQGAPVAEFLDGIHPDDRELASAAIHKAIDTAGELEVEYRLLQSDGTVNWVLARGRAYYGQDGTAERFSGIAVDVTRRKLAEDASRSVAAQFEALAENVSQLAWMAHADGSAYWFNRRWYEYTGTDLSSMQDWGWRAVHHPSEVDRVLEEVRHNLAQGRAWEGTYRLRSAAGDYRWFLTRAEPIRDDAGKLMRWFGTHTDVTAQRETDERLRELNQLLESKVTERTLELDRTWRLSQDLLVAADADGTLLAVNAAWTTLLGWEEHELVGSTFMAITHPDDVEPTRATLARIAQAPLTAPYEYRLRHKDGQYRWFAWTAAFEAGQIFANGRHTTAEHEQAQALARAEEQLRQSQKMEAVGQLTGGIAHDFNNMLAVVVGSLDLLGRRLGAADPRGRRYLDAAADGARRAALLTQRLLAFSRQQPLRPEPLDANRLVTGMAELLRRSLGGDIRLETVFAAGQWRTHADPNQLENVLLNLAVNARDAMPEGGKLTIETQNAHLDERYAAALYGVPSGQYVLIAISDTGSGMDEEVIAKAFDPFFTTKAVGKGTGLGLSQVYGFVKQSGGHVKIYSEPGQGTTVKIYLPRYLASGTDVAQDDVPQDVPLGVREEIILVVEDEPAVRQFSVDALTELGYRVLEADGAKAALRQLDTHPDIALLFTDVVMPETNGRKLADEARRRRPELKVLFTTGYTRNAVVHNGVLDTGVELIGKPFTIEELAAKVRNVLDTGVDEAAGQTR